MVGQSTFYGLTLATAVLINVAGSVFQGGICGLAGKFPGAYMNAFVSGQALGGIFASVASIGSTALGASATKSAFLFFMAADVTLISSLALYLGLASSVSRNSHSTISQLPICPINFLIC